MLHAGARFPVAPLPRSFTRDIESQVRINVGIQVVSTEDEISSKKTLTDLPSGEGRERWVLAEDVADERRR